MPGPASPSPFARALAALVSEGVDFVVVGVGGINFYAESPEDLVRTVDLDLLLDPRTEVLARALAALGDGARIDLMLALTGFRFDELAADAERFRLGAVEVPVGRLEKLLRAKELAGRSKDREFLRLYAARLRDAAERED